MGLSNTKGKMLVHTCMIHDVSAQGGGTRRNYPVKETGGLSNTLEHTCMSHYREV